jgi:Chaperone of endosialidase
MKKNIKAFVIGGFVASSLGALAVNIPNSFSAGTPIKASDVNANFGSLKTAVDSLEGSKFKLPYSDTTTDARPFSISSSNGADTTVAITGIVQNGTGIYGQSRDSVGVAGLSDSTKVNTPGVFGFNRGTTGQVVGVIGQSINSPIGSGVAGFGKITGGYFEASAGPSGGFNPTGVYGVANANSSTASGVIGQSGVGSGVRGVSTTGIGGSFETSSTGSDTPALALRNRSSGFLITAWNGASTDSNLSVFRVGNDGSVFSKSASFTSDRNRKTNFTRLNTLNVLEKVAQLPMSGWNYKDDASSLKHIGPMAQDFHAAFGLNGKDDTHINVVDSQGVALAAIQGLNQKLESENKDLRSKLSNLESRLIALEKK